MTSRVVIPVLESLEQNKNPLVKTVVKGIKQIQHQAINSQSHSTTQTTFNFQPPSQNTVIDRRFELEMDVFLDSAVAQGLQPNEVNGLSDDGSATGPVGNTPKNTDFHRANFRATTQKTQELPTLTNVVDPATNPTQATQTAIVTAVNTALTALNEDSKAPTAVSIGNLGVDVAIGNNLAPRQFPLTNCMDSIDLVINGTHFSVSVNQYIQAVMSYTTAEWRDKNLPATPHAPDVYAEYSDNIRRATADNSLSLIGESFRNGEQPRGAYLRNATFGLNNGIGANSRASFSLREPLFISPLMAMLGHGLTNVNQLDITIRWNADRAKKMFSYFPATEMECGTNSLLLFANANAPADPTYVPTGSISATWGVANTSTSQAKLNVLYYTPQDDVDIPNEIILPYKQPQIEIQNCPAGVNGTINSNNIRLNQIPESCYIFVAQRNSNKVLNFADTYGRITNVNIKWKNQTGILSGFAEKDLIEMAVYNGFDSNVDEVLSGRGIVLKLNFGQDVPLDDNESPGTRGDYNWQVDITYADVPNQPNNDVVLTQVFVLNGHAIISPNECRVSTGVLSLEDNMNADDMGHSYQADEAQLAGGSMVGGSEVGGSLVGGFTKHIKKAYNVGKAAVKVGQTVAPAMEELVKAYQSRA